MAGENPQSTVPSRYTVSELQRIGALTTNLLGDIEPPQLFTATGAEDVLNNVTGAKKGVVNIRLENCGTNAVKVAINTAATADVFNAILKGSTLQDDGSGGVLDLKGFRGRVSIYSAAAHRVVGLIKYADL